MSFAKQRFDPTAKPLGRCWLNLDAVISTMNIVCGEYAKPSKAHRGAAELQVLSQEANLILLLAGFFEKEASGWKRWPSR